MINIYIFNEYLWFRLLIYFNMCLINWFSILDSIYSYYYSLFFTYSITTVPTTIVNFSTFSVFYILLILLLSINSYNFAVTALTFIAFQIDACISALIFYTIQISSYFFLFLSALKHCFQNIINKILFDAPNIFTITFCHYFYFILIIYINIYILKILIYINTIYI